MRGDRTDDRVDFFSTRAFPVAQEVFLKLDALGLEIPPPFKGNRIFWFETGSQPRDKRFLGLRQKGEEVGVSSGGEEFVGEGLAVFESEGRDGDDGDAVASELLDDFFEGSSDRW